MTSSALPPLTPSEPEIAIAHMLILRPRTATKVVYYFQNFFINEAVTYKERSHSFMPFGFSGVTVNRNGDNQPTQLAFPNNGLSRPWAANAVEGGWIVDIDTLLVNPNDKAKFVTLSEYVGQVTNVIWNDAELRVEISSVLDAVGNGVPKRRITEDVFGPLPTTAQIVMS